MAGEVVDAGGDGRLLDAGFEQLGGSESVEGMLEARAAGEGALLFRFVVAAGLVVEHFERRRIDFVDAVDAAGDAQGEAGPERDGDGLGAGQRLLSFAERAAERDFEADGC